MSQESPLNRGEEISAHLKDLKVEDIGMRLRGDLLRQCQVLLNELEVFQQCLVKQKKDNGVELRHFKNNVGTEVNSLEKVCNSSDVKHCEQTLPSSAKVACRHFLCQEHRLSPDPRLSLYLRMKLTQLAALKCGSCRS
jgi:hypothetical protein